MTDHDLAQIQLAIYADAPPSPDYWSHLGTGDMVYGIRRAEYAEHGSVDVICFRGSVTFKDWLLDFAAFADPFIHSGLGPVHPGFYAGMDIAWQQIRAISRAPRIVIGHSLGAARAAVLTGLMVLDGQAPVQRVVWGEPKSGFKPFASLISSVPTRSYRNAVGGHHDLVTDVPLSFPPEEYVHAGKLIDMCSPPGPEIREKFGIFALHHMPLYVAGMPQ